jgi:hypothetical protein
MTTRQRQAEARRYRRAGLEMLHLAAELDPAGHRRWRSQVELWQRRDEALHAACVQVWAWLWPREPWPAVRCRWTRRSDAYYGWADGDWRGGELLVSWRLARLHPSPLAIVLHEMAHLRGYDHGREMDAAVRRWAARLGVDWRVESSRIP